jgi:H+/Cl- antiporter ClcA
MDEKMRPVFVMSGISAGFGAVFGTPSRALFSAWKCALSENSVTKPSFPVSFLLCRALCHLSFRHNRKISDNQGASGNYSLQHCGNCRGVACFCLTARLFAVSVHKLRGFTRSSLKLSPARVCGKPFLLAVMLLSTRRKYGGLSSWMTDAAFGGDVRFFDPVLKFLTTVLTQGAGLQGGEVTPLFNIGASLGGFIGQLFHIETVFLAALGLIAVFGCAANAPVTTSCSELSCSAPRSALLYIGRTYRLLCFGTQRHLRGTAYNCAQIRR